MAQAGAQVLEWPGTAQKENLWEKLSQNRESVSTISPNGKGIDPPNDWLDDMLMALSLPPGPYTYINAEEYLDTEPVELYNGWLVRQEMADFNTKIFEGDLGDHLSSAARIQNFGLVLSDQMECMLDDGTVIKPDLSLISWVRQEEKVIAYGPNDRPTLVGSPELVVEIRSPSNRRPQEKKKRSLYFRNGAEVIWDIDEETQVIYVYRADAQDDPEIYTVDDEITCEPFLTDWRRRVSDLFEKEAPIEVVFAEVVDTYREEGEKIGEQRGKEIGCKEGKKIGLKEGEKIGEQRGKEIGLVEGEKLGKEIGREEGREEGEKIGEQRGILLAKQETLLQILTLKFGTLSDEATQSIQQTDDIEQLNQWVNQALTAQSLDDIFK